MLGIHSSSTDGFSRRLAALRGELDHLQTAFQNRQSDWSRSDLGRMAADAQDWVAERAEALPSLSLDSIRRHLPTMPHRPFPAETPALPVIVAAVAVGVGVGCVLYAVTSRGRRSARGSRNGSGRRSATGPAT